MSLIGLLMWSAKTVCMFTLFPGLGLCFLLVLPLGFLVSLSFFSRGGLVEYKMPVDFCVRIEVKWRLFPLRTRYLEFAGVETHGSQGSHSSSLSLTPALKGGSHAIRCWHNWKAGIFFLLPFLLGGKAVRKWVRLVYIVWHLYPSFEISKSLPFVLTEFLFYIIPYPMRTMKIIGISV